MYKQETIKPYSQEGEKGEQVELMFDNIAPTYDRLNHLLSFNVDRYWRRAALKTLVPYQPQHILDMATGTGDFALLAARMLRPATLTGADLSEGMLAIARQKLDKARTEKKSEELAATTFDFQKQDCMALTLASDHYDAATVAYGVRNFPDLERGLSEMLRVLKPGGRLVIIELSSPKSFPMKQLFWLYSHVYMPTVGRLLSKDRQAYKYLPATMEAFPQGEPMVDILTKVGYVDVKYKPFTFGLSTLYTAAKP